MRQSLHVLRAFVILLVLSLASHARADERSDARAHYTTAAKLYQSGDYRTAIREFSAAQQLVPADLNNYNLALCYDKLGDAEPAIQYYRAFLDKQPNTDKRSEIEASIARLDAAVKSAASKKAAPVAAPVPAPAAVKDDAPVLGPAAPGPDVAIGPAPGPAAGPAVGPAAHPPAPDAEPRKKKHGPAVQATGDAQLDRVNGMSIDEIRDQRGVARPDGAAAGPTGQGQLSANQPPPPSNTLAPNPNPGGGEEPKKEAPVYKKWWFWAVVAVSAYVVISIATDNSKDTAQSGLVLPPIGAQPPVSGGYSLLRF
jgi:Tetratricopeptide repeat